MRFDNFSNSYENAILNKQELETDECSGCKYKGNLCKNQYQGTTVIYNPNLR